MFNLLRMDLYRIVKSRSMYVCFGIVQVFAVMSVMLLWLLGKGHEFAVIELTSCSTFTRRWSVTE